MTHQPALIGHYFDEARHTALPCALLAVYEHTRMSMARSGKIQHRFWVLDYSVTTGGACKAGRGRWIDRGHGVAHLYPPHLPYWEDTTGTKPPLQSMYFLFSGGELLDLQRFMKNKIGYARFLDPEGILEAELAQTVADCHARREEGFLSAQSHLFRIADLLGQATPCQDEQPGMFSLARSSIRSDGKGTLAKDVADHLRNNLDKPLALSGIARRMGVSVSTLSHKYRAEAGESPLRTLAKLRINLAKGLVAKGESLKSIAERTGFYDEFHLSKTFKRITGLSPRAFLRRKG